MFRGGDGSQDPRLVRIGVALLGVTALLCVFGIFAVNIDPPTVPGTKTDTEAETQANTQTEGETTTPADFVDTEPYRKAFKEARSVG